MLGRCKKDAFCATYLFISRSFCVELKGWGSVCWFVQSHFNSNLMGRHPPATSPPHKRFWIPLHRRSHSKYVPPGYASKFVQKFLTKKNFTNLGHKFLVHRNLTACLSHLRCFRPLRIQRKRSKPHGPHSLTGRRRQDVTLTVTVGATYFGVAKRDSALQSAVVGVTWVAEVRQWHRRYHESWVL